MFISGLLNLNYNDIAPVVPSAPVLVGNINQHRVYWSFNDQNYSKTGNMRIYSNLPVAGSPVENDFVSDFNISSNTGFFTGSHYYQYSLKYTSPDFFIRSAFSNIVLI